MSHYRGNPVTSLKRLGWKRRTMTSFVHETGARAFMDASGSWVAVRPDGNRNAGIPERSRAFAWATERAA